MSKQLSEEIKERINNINFFKNCNSDVCIEFDFVIRRVNDWAEAESFFSSDEWEGVTLEFRNELTEYIHGKNKNIYNYWNEYAGDGREFIAENIEHSLSAYQVNNNLDPVFLDCVNWDLLNSMLYLQYSNVLTELPDFYNKLLMVYEAGHYPCGWEGDYMKGNLIII